MKLQFEKPYSIFICQYPGDRASLCQKKISIFSYLTDETAGTVAEPILCLENTYQRNICIKSLNETLFVRH